MDDAIIEKIENYCKKQGDDDFLHGSLDFVKNHFHEIMELRSRFFSRNIYEYFDIYSFFTQSEKMLFFMMEKIEELYYSETLNKTLMTSIILINLEELYRIKIQLERNKKIARYFYSKPKIMKLLLNRNIY